ncbi:unnamed protein product [Calicophoron daubneyi]|uniref:Uncharacterized protein n=1 Tax=Calicophoron daubneyi TaxID=300641 RepID=A0AAV2TIG8_CALDB
MIQFLSEIPYWLHLSPFELCVQLIGLLVSSVLLVLRDEGIWLSSQTEAEYSKSLWYIFFPLWCADGVAAYFNLLAFSRRVNFHRNLQLRAPNKMQHSFCRPPWNTLFGNYFYPILVGFCIFLFKLLLYQKFTSVNPFRFTYSMVFSPIICALQLTLLAILFLSCRRRCS